MERKEMKKRAKGLLALLLAFIMMFGTSLTVFAAGTTYSLFLGNASPDLQGTIVDSGDKITFPASGFLKVVINDRTEYDKSPDTAVDGAGYYSYTLTSGPYRASFSSSQTAQGDWFYTVTLTTPDSGSATNNTGSESNTGSKSKKKDSTGTTNTHVHSYSWVTVQEASEGQDGIEQYRCSCGDVQETNVIPATQAVIEEMLAPVRGQKKMLI